MLWSRSPENVKIWRVDAKQIERSSAPPVGGTAAPHPELQPRADSDSQLMTEVKDVQTLPRGSEICF